MIGVGALAVPATIRHDDAIFGGEQRGDRVPIGLAGVRRAVDQHDRGAARSIDSIGLIVNVRAVDVNKGHAEPHKSPGIES